MHLWLTRDQVRRRECKLLDFSEVVLWISVQDHAADFVKWVISV